MLCILVIAVEKEIVNILSSLGENEDYNGKYLLITLCLKDRCTVGQRDWIPSLKD